MQGTAEEFATSFKEQCKTCVYAKAFGCGGKYCLDGNVLWLNSPAPIELTQTEREICVGLKHLGYNYLARDETGDLDAYPIKPNKDNHCWDIWEENIVHMETTDKTFDFIRWEDEEPTSIDDLLKVEG